jgi:hypothetical protein
MRNSYLGSALFAAVLVCVGTVGAADGFVTRTFGNREHCEVRGVLQTEAESIRFDLSALSPAVKVWRAVLRVSSEGHQHGAAVRLVPVGFVNAEPLELRPPFHDRFDATQCVRSWVANPGMNKGLTVEQRGGIQFADAVLEVSLADAVTDPIPQISELQALHQCGQTFLTWREIDDPMRDESPRFEVFERQVLQHRRQQGVVYRVYRHTRPITLENLGRDALGDREY